MKICTQKGLLGEIYLGFHRRTLLMKSPLHCTINNNRFSLSISLAHVLAKIWGNWLTKLYKKLHSMKHGLLYKNIKHQKECSSPGAIESIQ